MTNLDAFIADIEFPVPTPAMHGDRTGLPWLISKAAAQSRGLGGHQGRCHRTAEQAAAEGCLHQSQLALSPHRVVRAPFNLIRIRFRVVSLAGFL